MLYYPQGRILSQYAELGKMVRWWTEEDGRINRILYFQEIFRKMSILFCLIRVR
jgi:hypothetical protein